MRLRGSEPPNGEWHRPGVVKMRESGETTPAAASPDGANLMALPTEIHLLITRHLIYPDALSLKHTNRHFYELVYTGVNLKIEWLIERRKLHLDCPHDKACELGSDRRFCRGSVALLMKRRREHGDCDRRPNGRGCLIFDTDVCTFPRKSRAWAITRWGPRIPAMVWLALGFLGLLTAWAWTGSALVVPMLLGRGQVV